MHQRRVVLASRPRGIAQAFDFRIEEQPVPGLREGQVLVRNAFLSVEPAMRGWIADAGNYSAPVQVGDVMRALAAGTVVASRNPDWREGDQLCGWFGWQEMAVVDVSAIVRRIREADLPLSLSLGVLGNNGVNPGSGSSGPARRGWCRARQERSARQLAKSRRFSAAAPSESPAARRR